MRLDFLGDEGSETVGECQVIIGVQRAFHLTIVACFADLDPAPGIGHELAGGEAAGAVQEVTASVLLKPAMAPLKYSYRLETSFPHDTSSYTQGLEYHEGVFSDYP